MVKGANVFTLFKMHYMTEEAFEQDAMAVMNDLKVLKEILEKEE